MGLLQKLFGRKKEQPANVSKEPEVAFPLAELVDRTTDALEEILWQTPDFDIMQNQMGECYGVESSRIRGSLKSMYEFAVAIRGKSQDYFNLASIETDEAQEIDEDSKALPHYQSAINYLRKIKLDDRGVPYHSALAINLFKLWQCKEDDIVGEGNQEILREAYSEAQTLLSFGGKFDTYTTSHIGQIFVEMADSDDPNVDISEKERLFRQGIGYLQEVTNSDAESYDFYELGNAQATFADHCLDFQERITLRRNALENLRKSHELDRDPETLDYIREIEDDGFEFSREA